MNNLEKNLAELKKHYHGNSSIINKAAECISYIDRLEKVYSNAINLGYTFERLTKGARTLDLSVFLIMKDYDYDYTKTVTHKNLKGVITGENICSVCKRLIALIKTNSKDNIKEVKRAKTLIPVTFDFGPVDNNSRSDEEFVSKNRHKPAGKIVTFEYYCKPADLWVFNFDGHQFPLYENEFVWL